MERQDEMIACLQQMLDGSVPAFDRFYERYAPFVMKIALRMLGERMEAEDICHDLFVEILHRRKLYDQTRGSIEAWLAVMTRSRCLDRLRRTGKVVITPTGEERADAETAAHAASPVEQVVQKMQREALHEAMGRLPAAQQRAVTSSFFNNRTHQEMSDSWQVPLGTVKSWVRYGLNHLRKEMEKRGWTDERREKS
ncbi:RNA polymerase sigma factor [Paenibacillus sp. GCM10027626]|uniref:RNA polymerase sigma factor n=1 Tax=Paenibacillus sp. GCM10027626 TaxID=3273411 RepID=UPI00362CF434